MDTIAAHGRTFSPERDGTTVTAVAVQEYRAGSTTHPDTARTTPARWSFVYLLYMRGVCTTHGLGITYVFTPDAEHLRGINAHDSCKPGVDINNE
ncbi:hypothetical protein C8T65DRAFT_670590 [Cerioporus squamosus]|nr:hypothetical protein C8T65DRAFT_670590 [Cerioporus squamosus]